jgi:Transposase DDE domain
MDRLGPGDVRTSARGAWLFDQIVSLGTVVLKDLGGDRAGEIAAHRYLSSPYVTSQGVLEALGSRTGEACAGLRVVAAQDTTQISFAGKSAGRRGLGPGGDGKSAGFFIHAVVAVDARDEAVLGVVGARIWTRGPEPVSDRGQRPVEAKESRRWNEGAQIAAEQLGSASQVVVVGDQEADIYSHFARRPARVELLVRARHDRVLVDGGTLFEQSASWPVHTQALVAVSPRGPGDKGRVAQVTIRGGPVTVARPASAETSDPASLLLGLVEVCEPNPPAGVKPLLWRLITTLPVDGAQAAQEVVRLYRLRWRIEEVFRALKSDGLRLEETQLRDPVRVFRLAALALGAAARIIQLVDARDGGSRPMSDVLDSRFTQAVAAISRSREGGTARQRNPHPQGSLAWLAWVIARYGGWNCYGKPPGPKTMAKGWERFSATLAGFVIATANADV